MYKFFLEINGEYARELERLLKKENIDYDSYIRRTFDIPTLIGVTAGTLQIIDLIHRWYKKQKNRGERIQIKIYKSNEKKIYPGREEEIPDWENKTTEEIEVTLTKE